MSCCKPIKYLLCFVFAAASLYPCKGQKKDSLPRPVGYVNDFEKIFSVTQVKYLDSLMGDFDHKTTNQFAVITVDTSMVSKEDFDGYVLKIAKAWGVGQKKKDNGIVIGFSRAYRKIRIENGYGIEKIISDADTKAILDSAILPYFKKGEYFEGTLEGLKTIMARLKK